MGLLAGSGDGNSELVWSLMSAAIGGDNLTPAVLNPDLARSRAQEWDVR